MRSRRIVIDYKMPAMSGIELASRLRNRDTDAPIILITGYPDKNILEKAAAAGIHRVLLKLHLEESLVSRIRGAIQESHLVQPLSLLKGPALRYRAKFPDSIGSRSNWPVFLQEG